MTYSELKRMRLAKRRPELAVIMLWDAPIPPDAAILPVPTSVSEGKWLVGLNVVIVGHSGELDRLIKAVDDCLRFGAGELTICTADTGVWADIYGKAPNRIHAGVPAW